MKRYERKSEKVLNFFDPQTAFSLIYGWTGSVKKALKKPLKKAAKNPAKVLFLDLTMFKAGFRVYLLSDECVQGIK